jgi:hypothetical protein
MFPKKKLKPDANKDALNNSKYAPQKVVKKQPSYRKKK